MNAIEIEEAISILNRNPFDPDEFPYSFLEAYGNKPTTIKRLRKGDSNNSDLNGVLQRKNIHISISKNDQVTQTLKKLKESPETKKAKARFILSTDGNTFEAEDLFNGEIISCKYCDFANYFAFFLPLAGINITKEIQENAFDIRATSRLNKLYIELLNQNPKWSENNLRAEMNTFMTRLIFCFFAEDTDIFGAQISFTKTIEQISSTDATNTNVIISQIFKVMNIPKELRENETIPKWALDFPYVNGGLFSGNIDVPKFSKIARSYLIHIGNLDWQKINPDIFFHCAGSNPITPLIEATQDVYINCFNLHFLSASQICRGSIEVQKKDQNLKFFLISSIWSLISADSRGPYSIAKSALNSFARQIAVEFGLNDIQAISIALGFINTNLTNLTKNDIRISNAKQRYLFHPNEYPDPKKVASLIFHLSLQDLSLLNGNTINLDGGILCQ